MEEGRSNQVHPQGRQGVGASCQVVGARPALEAFHEVDLLSSLGGVDRVEDHHRQIWAADHRASAAVAGQDFHPDHATSSWEAAYLVGEDLALAREGQVVARQR